MQIKNLSQLKRVLNDRHMFQIIEHKNCPQYIGDVREVNIMQTNGMYSRSVLNLFSDTIPANNGKGTWLPFGKASDWTFTGDLCTLKDTWTIKVLDKRS